MTFVVPAYNAARYLAATLASIEGQSLPDWEAVVVDDGSTDETAAIARQAADPRIRVVEQPNAGVAAARNRGAAEARGAFLVFLDAHDLLEPNYLATLLPHAGAAPVVYGNASYIDAEGRPIRRGELQHWTRARLEGDVVASAPRLTGGPCIMTPGQMLVRKDAHAAIDGFDPRLRLVEDWDYALRLAELQPLVLIDEVVLLYRRHEQNASMLQAATSRRGAQAVRLRAVQRSGGSRRRRVLSEHRRFYWGMARYHARAGAWKEATRALPLCVAYLPLVWRPYRAVIARWIGNPMASTLR